MSTDQVFWRIAAFSGIHELCERSKFKAELGRLALVAKVTS